MHTETSSKNNRETRESEVATKKKSGPGSSAVGLVSGGLLLLATCIHVGVFVAVTVRTQLRLDDLDLKVYVIQEESSLTHHRTRTQRSAPSNDEPEVGGSNPEPKDLLQTFSEVQKHSVQQLCRREIGELLKQLTDVSFHAENEAERTAVRTRIDSWVSKAADDRPTRETAGNELGGIFDQIANAEIKIFQKYCGNASKICLPGDKGAQGPKGAPGAQGVKGNTGTAGPKGEHGGTGMAGPRGGPGPKGDKGEGGSSGARGAKGDTGPSGTAGPQGTKGAKGATGVRGAKGETGIQGTRGSTGDKGRTGDTGKQGPSGEKGDKGSKGHYGDSGPPGPKGEAGYGGVPGPRGHKGEKGQTGQTGTPGHRGADGAKGDTGTRGPSGQAGQRGQKGSMGLSGPPGPKGDMGYPGVPGGRGQKGDPGVWRPGMLSCCLALSKPKFLQSEQQVTVKEDQSLTLTCGTQLGFPPPQVTWEPQGLIHSEPHRYKVSAAGSLVILNTTALDNRKFTCTAANTLGASEKTLDIRVLQHLVIAGHPGNVTVTEGDVLRLECRVNVTPTSALPSFTWYHVTSGGARREVTSGVTTDASGGDSILSISNTHVSHRGTYVCEVKDDFETTSMTENVIVLSKPYITNSSGPTVTGREGEDVLLYCSSDTVPTAVIHWNHDRNDSHVYEDSEGHLHIVAARKVDAGGYTCTATNSLGTDNRTIQVEVQVPPKVILKPEFTPLKPSLLFDCIVSGDEPLQTRWLKGEAPLDKSTPGNFIQLPDTGTETGKSNRLLITHTTDEDVGMYQCEARNTHGTKQDRVYVYQDMQQVSCSDTFSVCNRSVCGAHCRNFCQFAAEPVTGSGTYSVSSSICKAAVHSGILGEGEGGTVVWTNDVNTVPFSALTVHGIQSAGSIGGAIESVAATPVGLDSTSDTQRTV